MKKRKSPRYMTATAKAFVQLGSDNCILMFEGNNRLCVYRAEAEASKDSQLPVTRCTITYRYPLHPKGGNRG